nr:MAG TPA: hypothetical protein [Caudoviricetes sp.]
MSENSHNTALYDPRFLNCLNILIIHGLYILYTMYNVRVRIF